MAHRISTANTCMHNANNNKQMMHAIETEKEFI